MSQPDEPNSRLQIALDHARRLLLTQPDLAAAQAADILQVLPNHAEAQLLQGVALRAAGRLEDAFAIFESLIGTRTNSAIVHYEFGITLVELGFQERAMASFRRSVELSPDFADGWRAIGDQLTYRNDVSGADAAYTRQICASTKDPRLAAAGLALRNNRIAEAERRLKQHLWHFPTDVTAIRMLAEVAGRLGRYQDAENLLSRCLELAPSFNAARHNYALALHRQNKSAAALEQIERLSTSEPKNAGYRNLKAVVLAKIGDFKESLAIYADVLERLPNEAKLWMSYGHALATAGQEAKSIEAYRRSIELAPTLGEAYWSLANLKTFRFSAGEVAAMRSLLSRPHLAVDDQLHLHFALGKADEDGESYESAMEHYSAGNSLRREGVSYSADDTTAFVGRCKTLLTGDYFKARQDYGEPAADPVFIVGLPRAGSTLLEQILASHSAVEGTGELPDILAMAQAMSGKKGTTDKSHYPDALATLGKDGCRELGQQYLRQTRIQRKTAKPFFIDKMPNNFAHVALIHQILPHAKIIDARRSPLACCFSNYKQHFARGQHYTYSQSDVGRYYRDYVELMAHFDAVLPGRIHRVMYESLVADTETEVRRLLSYCGLPFETACLRFHDNDRAVRTASKQQVRQPIYRDGLHQWRHFEPWLTELKASLGSALQDYA